MGGECEDARKEFLVGRAGGSGDLRPVTPQEKTQALEAARIAGIDLQLLEANLALTAEERALQHESALELAMALRKAGAALYAKSPLTDSAAR